MTSREYDAIEAALADSAYQIMQEANEALSAINRWTKDASAAYANHFGYSPAKWNIIDGLVTAGLGVVAIGGLGEAALVAATAWESTMLALDALAAVFSLAGGSAKTVVGIAQLSQPNLSVGFVTDLASDPFNLFIGVNYGLTLGRSEDALKTGVEKAGWASFFYSGISTTLTLVGSSSNLNKAGSIAGFAKSTADRWMPPSSDSGPFGAPTTSLPSPSADRELLGAPEHYIFGDPQRADDSSGDRAPNPFGENLPVAHGGGDPVPTPTTVPDPTPNQAPSLIVEPIPEPGLVVEPIPEPEHQDPKPDIGSGPEIDGGGVLP